MKEYNYYHYNNRLKQYAKNLRNDSTSAEIKIWSELLRAKQMMGFRFLRQRPIGKYIVDFFCKELKLIIEIDGVTHHYEDVCEKDIAREKYLKLLGYSILRFSDDEIINDIDLVYELIKEFILKIKKKE
ncbi:MAG: hypothetical protein JWN78_2281 [Bacteroidota bacterium]|nr:hypothetical protein [Bacteroidota bacterium]